MALTLFWRVRREGENGGKWRVEVGGMGRVEECGNGGKSGMRGKVENAQSIRIPKNGKCIKI